MISREEIEAIVRAVIRGHVDEDVTEELREQIRAEVLVALVTVCPLPWVVQVSRGDTLRVSVGIRRWAGGTSSDPGKTYQ